MGAFPSIVLTLHTPSPEQDANDILKMVPGKFRVDNQSRDCFTVVDEAVTIFLVRSSVPSSMVLVADVASIEQAVEQANVSATEVDGYVIGEVSLASGARIFLTTEDASVSLAGRKALADCLGRQQSVSVEIETRRVPASSVDEVSLLSPPKAKPSPRLPEFLSLQTKLMETNGNYRSDFFPNMREPFEFETELFKGRVLLLMRPHNPATDDPFWNERVFSKKNRRLILQVQGQFKREPQGVIYAGAEVSKPMKLGLVTRGLCKILLGLVESFNPSMHYSYGDDKEKAHIVVPAYKFFERIQITKPDETPPALEEPFEETAESISRRKKQDGTGVWNTTDTFSFSFYSMYFDLPTWQLVGLPISGNVSLKTFWGDSLLYLCMYEKPFSGKPHLQSSLQYAFSIQLKYLGWDRKTTDDTESREEDEADDVFVWQGKRFDIRDDDSMNRSESQLFPGDKDSVVSDNEDFFDSKQEMSVEVRAEAPQFESKLLAKINKACPYWIDLIRNRGGPARAFALAIGESVVFRSQQDVEDLMRDCHAGRIVLEHFSPRLSAVEQLRRMIGCALSDPGYANLERSRLNAFVSASDSVGDQFLRRPEPSLPEKEKASARWASYVARAVSERHWSEEYAVMTPHGLHFFYPEKKRPVYRVRLSGILKVSELEADERPCLFGLDYVVLETIGRSIYLMFASTTVRDGFLEELSSFLSPSAGSKSDYSLTTDDIRVLEIENPADEFLHDSTVWNCKNRRLLNNGSFFFSERKSAADPLEMVERTLRLASEAHNDATGVVQRHVFLVSAAELKQADVCGLSEAARMAFFLNLYHVMVLHSYLVVGPPDSSFKWISYFNKIAYEVSDDIFSLAELEHCIIRAKMNYPSQFISRFVLPKSRYRMALATADFRINFALNCGSLSNPAQILVYKPDRLDEFLDKAAQLYLDSVTAVQRNSGDVVVQMPRVCQWFLDDFGSQEDLLTQLRPYLRPSVRKVLNTCWSSRRQRFKMNMLSVRYYSYSFECRTPDLL